MTGAVQFRKFQVRHEDARWSIGITYEHSRVLEFRNLQARTQLFAHWSRNTRCRVRRTFGGGISHSAEDSAVHTQVRT